MHGVRFSQVFMLAAAIVSAVLVVSAVTIVLSAQNRMLAPYQPLGGDFINLFAVGQMLLGGKLDAIYDPDAVMAFERSIIDAEIGFRLWAYPPHSLFFVWPFGLVGFEWALALWSALGLVALFLAARRYGFSLFEAGLLVVSPATMTCVLLGQTGTIVTALFLVALSARSARDPLSIGGTALLTIKPQMGFLLPLLWFLRGQWRLIAWTAGAVVLVIGSSVLVFGLDAWRGYLFDTMPILADLEHDGTGPFMLMIPSVFMAGRHLGLAGDLAFAVHIGFAVPMFAWLVWRLRRSADNARQDALLLVGIVLITPYLHLYDLSLLSAAVLIVLRKKPSGSVALGLLQRLLLVLAWLLPLFLMQINAAGWPVAPVILLGLFALI